MPRPHSLEFRIGHAVYSVVVVQRIKRDGKRLMGEAIADERRILISGEVLPAARMEVLLHEIRHCWSFSLPKPRTEEEEANLFAMIAGSAMLDLSNQGGEPALMALRPCKSR